MKKLIVITSPFINNVDIKDEIVWIKPKLIAEIKFQEWTKEGKIRIPIFISLREDKNPNEVVRENNSSIEKTINFSNLNKIFFPKENLTKGDVANYYKEIGPYIIPHLKGRPITLHRFPNGITTKGFYQKNIVEELPKWFTTKKIKTKTENKVINWAVIDNLESLLYLVNLGDIEINPWTSRIDSLNYPDYAIADLDTKNGRFDRVVEVAFFLHSILEEKNLPHHLKTSGGNGLHIYIPLGGKYTHDQSRNFVRLLGLISKKYLPQIVSLEFSPAKRKNLVYVDYRQNRIGQNTVAVYSVRPKDGAPISTPLRWEELNTNLDPRKFNIKTVPQRVKNIGDLWKNIYEESIDLPKTLLELEKYI